MADNRSLCRPRVHALVGYIVYVPRGACCALKVLLEVVGRAGIEPSNLRPID